MTPFDVVVIGSGPTAYAAVLGCRSRGLSVEVIDIGERLDARTEATVREARSIPPIRWTEDLQQRLDGAAPRLDRIAEKLYFGTDVPYRSPAAAPFVGADGTDALPLSAALGGFSNVWGAGILTPSAADLEDWPIDPDALRASYRALADLIPIAGSHDGLDGRYPFPGQFGTEPNLSGRFTAILGAATGNQESVLVGAARLAVQGFGAGCTRCGRCLVGCPYGAIFNSGDAIRALADSGAISYRGRTAVLRIVEDGDAVTLECIDVDTQVRASQRAGRVLVAAGPIGSVALLQRSALCPASVDVRDSQVFYVPVVHRRPWTPDAGQFTLGQLFAVSARSNSPDDDFQMTVYDTSDELAGRISLSAPKALRPVAQRLAPRLSRRLTGGIGFLHSAMSGSLRVATLNDRTTVTAVRSDATRPTFQRVAGRIRRALRPTGLDALTPAVQMPSPGTGFHIGAGLPMSRDRAPGRSDPSGRPDGCRRVHVVDASVLPVLLPGPTTFTAMANAHRIASTLGDVE